MEVEGLLVLTAVVFRRQKDVDGKDKTDRFGQPTRDEVEHHREPCRLTTASGGEVMAERSRDVVSANYKLYVGRAGDVREKDVVTVIDKAGRTLVERGEVLLAAPVHDGVGLLHHWECRLNTQREATG